MSTPDADRVAVRSDRAPEPAGAYSQGVLVDGVLYCAGQVGLDPTTRRAPESIHAQTSQALRNLEAVISKAGGSLDDVVSVTVFLHRASDAPAFDASYRALMPEPWPARATVGVELPDPFLIEMSAIAVIPTSARPDARSAADVALDNQPKAEV